MSKRIGILGGISHESTIKYYEFLLKKYYSRYRNYHYPEVVIFSLDLKKLTQFEDSENLEGYVDYLMTGIEALQNAGADFAAIAANSPHAVFDILQTRSSIPLISIVEVTALEARRRNLRSLLLMGIQFTMKSSFYADVFRQYDMKIITPNPADQEEINRIIFRELVIGVHKEKTRQNLYQMMRKYPADGVILGCTELSLILNQEDTNIPLLNTLELHNLAVLDFATGE